MKTFNLIFAGFAALATALLIEAHKSGLHPNFIAALIALVLTYILGYCRVTMLKSRKDIDRLTDEG